MFTTFSLCNDYFFFCWMISYILFSNHFVCFLVWNILIFCLNFFFFSFYSLFFSCALEFCCVFSLYFCRIFVLILNWIVSVFVVYFSFFFTFYVKDARYYLVIFLKNNVIMLCLFFYGCLFVWHYWFVLFFYETVSCLQFYHQIPIHLKKSIIMTTIRNVDCN